ncbi:uncharacterized protein PSFLO_02301 [Pseudozyma flocculosa]|uniref:Uncharacterized protein n=1 Tax=Pseudozyma flocculosa TaxID=84751 RepID=A0A5C3EY79_9BASI|nr:uncharacterized protein PSFLO_02301 [Pseudozyma flocculosa]
MPASQAGSGVFPISKPGQGDQGLDVNHSKLLSLASWSPASCLSPPSELKAARGMVLYGAWTEPGPSNGCRGSKLKAQAVRCWATGKNLRDGGVRGQAGQASSLLACRAGEFSGQQAGSRQDVAAAAGWPATDSPREKQASRRQASKQASKPRSGRGSSSLVVGSPARSRCCGGPNLGTIPTSVASPQGRGVGPAGLAGPSPGSLCGGWVTLLVVGIRPALLSFGTCQPFAPSPWRGRRSSTAVVQAAPSSIIMPPFLGRTYAYAAAIAFFDSTYY